ncbi:cryptochrome/photolyase family protein [Legionella maioricensis]|uniref:Deoxyribodipyrimidine photo-lyase n=1 Tax=Legionella maioricensis TaxID=2896528 RepID=A0A9X2D149_9GAMM|nr:deoxyribodipyrimidine photo-lyase [Legionella maioricensis]MCL9684478.1 DNA photolyase family protein [Legionella maioricensis]MCL9688819.1 DNA photolyase family protein [Legionella maioricensis]
MSTALFWFRQDLRCRDNSALALACKNHQKLIPIYIKDSEPDLPMGRAQQWWLYHSLLSLKDDLNKVGLTLCFRQAEPLILLKELIVQHQVDAVYWNRCYEPMHINRDRLIKAELRAMGVKVISCNSSLLLEPWEVLNQSGSFFKVFTAYWRQCLRQIQERPPIQISEWPSDHPVSSESLAEWNLLPQHPNWAAEFSRYWQPGENAALAKLDHFISDQLQQYKALRNEPAIFGTSRLSPHLHFGEISPHQVWAALQQVMQDPDSNLPSVQTYLSELGWREFSYYLLYHYPQLINTNFKSQFDRFPWQQDEINLRLWQKGLTGYPIVDAGMRELWHTGYMHNRVRMIVASFLTKDLMIDWRKGAAWFWDTLLDADLANNSASWQWVAGSGADAAPYYRIFNPVLQGEKFDPQGEYVKQWIPELASMSKQWVHQPWQAPKDALPLVLGVDYPFPIVDHRTARQVALSNYRALKE